MFRYIKNRNNFGAVGCDSEKSNECDHGDRNDNKWKNTCCECEPALGYPGGYGGETGVPRSCASTACVSESGKDGRCKSGPNPNHCLTNKDCEYNQICKNGSCKPTHKPQSQLCIDGYLYKYNGYKCYDNIESNTRNIRNTPDITCEGNDVVIDYYCMNMGSSVYCSQGCGYYPSKYDDDDCYSGYRKVFRENQGEYVIACIKE